MKHLRRPIVIGAALALALVCFDALAQAQDASGGSTAKQSDLAEIGKVRVSPSLLMYLAVAALLPLLPLALFKYPIADLLAKFFERLSGV